MPGIFFEAFLKNFSAEDVYRLDDDFRWLNKARVVRLGFLMGGRELYFHWERYADIIEERSLREIGERKFGRESAVAVLKVLLLIMNATLQLVFWVVLNINLSIVL